MGTKTKAAPGDSDKHLEEFLPELSYEWGVAIFQNEMAYTD